MRKIVGLLLCVALLVGCLGTSFGSAAAEGGTVLQYNGFNQADEFARSGVLSLCGSGTKTMDTKDFLEGTGSMYIDMPSSFDSFVAPFAYYTDLESSSYVNLSQYDYLELFYKSDVTLDASGGYNVQVRLVDTAVSIAGGGYEYQVPASLVKGQWNRAEFDLSAPYYVLDGMNGVANRIRLVMINGSGSYKEIDTRFDGVIFYDEAYKTARAAALAPVEEAISALPEVTSANLRELETALADIEAALAKGATQYRNFIPSNYNHYAAKKEACEQLLLGDAPSRLLVYNGFDSAQEVARMGTLSLCSATASLDTDSVLSGTGSVKIDMAEAYGDAVPPYAYYFDNDISQPVDLSLYDYVEFCYRSDRPLQGDFHYQLHLIDTSVSIAGSGYDYDQAISLLSTEWQRLSFDLGTPYYTLEGIGNTINRVRFILCNYTGSYQETDMNLDGVIFYDRIYAAKRRDAEEKVGAVLAEIPPVTPQNFRQLTQTFEDAKAAIEKGREAYVNFMPTGYSQYVEKLAMYNDLMNGGVITVNFSIPQFFSDHMLFQQQKPMNLWGKATCGSAIKGELYRGSSTTPVETVEVTAAEDNTWSLSFAPRSGSYDSYKIVISENTAVKHTIHNAAVGELWLATGQSNMEYRLDWAVGGAQAVAEANDSGLRVLLMPSDPVGTSAAHPAVPNYDIVGSRWGTGAVGSDIAGISAIAYFAARELREALDMPVGIINAAIGSTSIQAWMSRESIDENPIVKDAITQSGLYKTQADFAATVCDWRTMTAMYNVKIGPLAGMNMAGLFWCQGETNRDGKPNSTGFYAQAIQALAEGYGKAFGHEKGDMPVMVVNIASHPYNGDAQNIPKWIEEIAAAAASNENIVNIPIYDVPLTYQNPPDPTVAYPIHPNHKQEPGQRAGLAAVHNVYGIGGADYYPPTVQSYEVKDNAVFVTFAHTVNGLTTLEDSRGVHGFTLAGEDGVYLPAKATVESANTVKVWQDSIDQPVHFTYAFNSHAQTANLCNSYGLPAVPYRSNTNASAYFASNDWMLCDDTSVWVNLGATGDYQPTWQGSDIGDVYGLVKADSTVRYEGTGSIALTYEMNQTATAGAAVAFGYYLMPFQLYRYKYVSVMLRNDDDRDKTVRLLIGLQGEEDSWSLPVADGSKSPVYEVTVKANTPFTRYTFRVGNVTGYNTEATAPLTRVNRMDILVEDSASGSLYIDDVTVSNALPGEITDLPVTGKLAYGDVNEDGSVNANDALWVLQNAVGKRAFTDRQFLAGDVDRSETIDAADALYILKKAVGKIQHFPAQTAGQ